MMDKAVVDSLLSEVPSEVFDAVSPLCNRNSQAVFIALLKYKQMRFGEIKDLFQVQNSEEVNSPLKSLVKAALVSKKLECLEDVGNSEIAVYSPTFLGESVMRSLYKGVMIGADNVPNVQPPQILVYAHPHDNYTKSPFEQGTGPVRANLNAASNAVKPSNIAIVGGR